MKTTSKFTCPACQQPLQLDRSGALGASPTGQELVGVFCSYGPCPSQAANDGAIALDEASAFAILENLILDELAAN